MEVAEVVEPQSITIFRVVTVVVKSVQLRHQYTLLLLAGEAEAVAVLDLAKLLRLVREVECLAEVTGLAHPAQVEGQAPLAPTPGRVLADITLRVVWLLTQGQEVGETAGEPPEIMGVILSASLAAMVQTIGEMAGLVGLVVWQYGATNTLPGAQPEAAMAPS